MKKKRGKRDEALIREISIRKEASMTEPLRRLRKEKGLTAGEMAVILDIHYVYLYSLEREPYKLSEEILNRLEDRFGIDKEKFKEERDLWIQEKRQKIKELV